MSVPSKASASNNHLYERKRKPVKRAAVSRECDKVGCLLNESVKVMQERADIRRFIRDGNLKMSDLFELVDQKGSAAKDMRVRQALSAFPGVGSKRVRDVMSAACIPDGAVLGRLNDYQRTKLVKLMGDE